MNINFSKLTAAGNDFILIDNRENIIAQEDCQALAKKLCDRKYSIGADGLILLEKSACKDFKMKYFNSDGSYASMCGNGGRSIAKFAYDLCVANLKMVFETDAGVINAEILPEDRVRLDLYNPRDLKKDIKVEVNGKEFDVNFINTGVPHVVIFVDDIENIDVFGYGRAIRRHKTFAPAGTNVNFVKVIKDNTLLVRTYERGVEDETLACGTGITASGIISVLKGFAASPVKVIARGGDKLSVSLRNPNDKISNVVLEGPALITFKGTVKIQSEV
ncbi:diaminopimelate epimerase [Candidatus Endomicrobiellum trichonymphae]|uniref:Diaminopimelate epimerase n=1 Tax=Endomicrobium trichonymphae TaxID=1408204 RepID=B1GYN2_ENDTX|nr:diaminopimelate epimerase [Candidatus Endomicrobium trichonymphae]BAG14125.1 diaminopimelate epimerase [Candidatus Endomicrobium trichonymphae]